MRRQSVLALFASTMQVCLSSDIVTTTRFLKFNLRWTTVLDFYQQFITSHITTDYIIHTLSDNIADIMNQTIHQAHDLSGIFYQTSK